LQENFIRAAAWVKSRSNLDVENNTALLDESAARRSSCGRSRRAARQSPARVAARSPV